MATPILGRTANPFLFVAYALIALSLWTVDKEIADHSAQPTAASPKSGMPGADPPDGQTYASFVLPQNDKLYRPASSVLDQLATHESSSAENNDKDHDKRHRAAIALMVYLPQTVLKGKWSGRLYLDFLMRDRFPPTDFSL